MKRIYGNDAARVFSGIDMAAPNECWIWKRGCTAGGYAQIKVHGRVLYVHRLLYAFAKGSVPAGLHLDHLCRNRKCVNPAHLEAVEPIENWRRGESPTRQNSDKTHCHRGHSLADAYRSARGRRDCRTCRRDQQRARLRSVA